MKYLQTSHTFISETETTCRDGCSGLPIATILQLSDMVWYFWIYLVNQLYSFMLISDMHIVIKQRLGAGWIQQASSHNHIDEIWTFHLGNQVGALTKFIYCLNKGCSYWNRSFYIMFHVYDYQLALEYCYYILFFLEIWPRYWADLVCT